MVQMTNYFMNKSPHPIMNCKHTTTKEIHKIIVSYIKNSSGYDDIPTILKICSSYMI